MYCPNCGQASPEDRNFCKFCGTNLRLVSEALLRGTVPPKSLSETTAKILEDWFGEEPEPPPEEKQFNAIRGGVITTCVGFGVSLFLYFLMRGVASSPNVDPGAIPIIQMVWLVGLIPFFIGLGLLINGLFFYKPPKRALPQVSSPPARVASPETQRALSEPGVTIPPSVTEQTTHRLESPAPVRPERERERER